MTTAGILDALTRLVPVPGTINYPESEKALSRASSQSTDDNTWADYLADARAVLALTSEALGLDLNCVQDYVRDYLRGEMPGYAGNNFHRCGVRLRSGLLCRNEFEWGTPVNFMCRYHWDIYGLRLISWWLTSKARPADFAPLLEELADWARGASATGDPSEAGSEARRGLFALTAIRKQAEGLVSSDVAESVRKVWAA